MKFAELLSELRDLNLPLGEYAIFGSGPLAIRNLRESNDLDLIVKEKIWERLSSKYPLNEKGAVQIGNLEIFNKWFSEDINELIDSAEIIENLPFVKLEYVLKWKKEMNREKDKKDVDLINNLLNR